MTVDDPRSMRRNSTLSTAGKTLRTLNTQLGNERISKPSFGDNPMSNATLGAFVLAAAFAAFAVVMWFTEP